MEKFNLRRRSCREREIFGLGLKMGKIPNKTQKLKDPTVEIEPTKQSFKSAVDRSIGPRDRSTALVKNAHVKKCMPTGWPINANPIDRSSRPVDRYLSRTSI